MITELRQLSIRVRKMAAMEQAYEIMARSPGWLFATPDLRVLRLGVLLLLRRGLVEKSAIGELYRLKPHASLSAIAA